MRIGLYGGSFDPVHRGHLLVAQAALEELVLDRLVFIPAAQSPFKPHRELAPAPDRLRLLRLALAGKNRCEVDDLEIKRGGVSYSADTLREYQRAYPGAELFYLIGEDHAGTLSQWREADALARMAEFVVIPRPSEGGAGTGEKGGRAGPHLPAPFRGRLLAGFPLRLSSSQIRGRVRAGQSIEELVPSAVAEAIENNRLYL